MSPGRLAAVLAVALAACSDKAAPAGGGSGAGSSTAAPAGDGYQPAGFKPDKARQPSPASVKKQPAGTPAPAIELRDATGATWSLANALTKAKRVVLVFYRGDW
jgi:hypothetical protein